MDTTRLIISTIVIFGLLFIGLWVLFSNSMDSIWSGLLVATGLYIGTALIVAGIISLLAWTYHTDFWSVISG